MTKQELRQLNLRLQSLAIFRSLLDDPVIAALSKYLSIPEMEDITPSVSAYSEFVAQLFRTEKRTLAGYIQSIVGNDENPYIHMIGKGAILNYD